MKIWQLFENFSLSELNANFAELLASINGTKATYLTANKTVYVATTGSDTTGDGQVRFCADQDVTVIGIE